MTYTNYATEKLPQKWSFSSPFYSLKFLFFHPFWSVVLWWDHFCLQTKGSLTTGKTVENMWEIQGVTWTQKCLVWGSFPVTSSYYSCYIIPLGTSKEGTDIAIPSVGITDTGQDEKSVVPAGRLVNLYAESKEFLSVKQHLEQRLEVALNEPVGMTPQFATNFLWQVNVHVCVYMLTL